MRAIGHGSGSDDSDDADDASGGKPAACGGLDAPVHEAGGNWSAGQRQLLCFARSMLKGSSLMVMDEATASVDMETDALLQRMLREELRDRRGTSVITVAHRLATIMDYDRVLVLDNGRLVEFGPPAVLLENAAGAFSSLVDEGGPAASLHLRSLANQAATTKLDGVELKERDDE